MNRTLITLTILGLYGPASAAQQAASISVGDSAGMVIGTEARCVESRGIPINDVPENKVKVACLKDRNVQWACNRDGSHARVKAYRQWVSDLMDFKERCSAVGGTFGFADPKFQEPTDDSFCALAQPEIQYSQFETPMCNFVSRCPGVAVTCLRTEDILPGPIRQIHLPGIPRPIAITSH